MEGRKDAIVVSRVVFIQFPNFSHHPCRQAFVEEQMATVPADVVTAVFQEASQYMSLITVMFTHYTVCRTFKQSVVHKW